MCYEQNCDVIVCVCVCARFFIEGLMVEPMPVCASDFGVWCIKYFAIHYVP